MKKGDTVMLWEFNDKKDVLEKIYEELRESEYPVFIWGLGSMSVEVEKRLEENGIKITGFFIDVDPQTAHRIPREKKIYTIAELGNIYKNINVVIGHGHYEKKDTLLKYKFIHEVYIISNPYLQYRVTGMMDYIHNHKAEIDDILNNLADDKSREALYAYCAVCETNNIDYLLKGDFWIKGMFGLEALNIGLNESYLDVGAWEGDSINAFLKETAGAYNCIYGIEPDPSTFPVLKKNMQHKDNIYLLSYGLGKEEGSFLIKNENTQSASLVKAEKVNNKTMIQVKTMDALFPSVDFSIIKISVPFLFHDILLGGEQCIRRRKPRLIVNVAADNEMKLFDTMKWILDLHMDYKIALRFDFPMPTRLYLYAY